MENDETTKGEETGGKTTDASMMPKKGYGHGHWSHWLKALFVIIVLAGAFSLGGLWMRWHNERGVGFYTGRGMMEVTSGSAMMSGRVQGYGYPGEVGGRVGGRGMMGRTYVQSGSGTIQDQSGETISLGGVSAISGNTLTVRINSTNTTVNISNSTSFYKNGVVAKQGDVQVGDVLQIAGKADSSGVISATSIVIQ